MHKLYIVGTPIGNLEDISPRALHVLGAVKTIASENPARTRRLLDRYQIRAGVAVNALAAERYPFLIEQFRKRKYEFIAHGHSASRMITSKMTEAEEKAEIADSIAAIEKAAGIRPRGWLGQDYGESARTPQLLADAGLD